MTFPHNLLLKSEDEGLWKRWKGGRKARDAVGFDWRLWKR
jgi:hypothetical protein